MGCIRVAAWLCLLWVSFVWGQIYKGTDNQGNVYLTDNPSHLPAPSRPKPDVRVGSPPPEPETPPMPSDLPIPPAQETRAPAPSTDLLGRGPAYWQALGRHWSAELARHAAERDRLQLLHHYTRSIANETRDVWARGRLEAEVERLGKGIVAVEQQIHEAQTMLQTTLPLEARRLGANPDWLNEPAPAQH
jgi:hypothetical protein